MRASYLHEYGKNQVSFNHDHELVSINRITHERKRAVVVYAPKEETTYGAGATLNLWSPTIETERAGELSNSQMWVLAKTGENISTIEVGWHVNPSLYPYGERPVTRLFIYWTSDGYKSSRCYNLLCEGFVMGESKWALGGAIVPTSELGGEQLNIDVLVKQDENKDWWLIIDNDWVGYWPNDILKGLVNGASLVEWGGEVHSKKDTSQHTRTEMGSGQFASEGFGRACYITQLVAKHTINEDEDEDEGLVKVKKQDLKRDVTDPNCYSLLTFPKDNQLWVFHGGPGLSSRCHI